MSEICGREIHARADVKSQGPPPPPPARSPRVYVRSRRTNDIYYTSSMNYGPLSSPSWWDPFGPSARREHRHRARTPGGKTQDGAPRSYTYTALGVAPAKWNIYSITTRQYCNTLEPRCIFLRPTFRGVIAMLRLVSPRAGPERERFIRLIIALTLHVRSQRGARYNVVIFLCSCSVPLIYTELISKLYSLRKAGKMYHINAILLHIIFNSLDV